MFEEINKRLEELSDGIYRYHKILRMTDRLQKQLFDLERRELDLRGSLEKETTDVEKLEKLSLHGLFYSVLGTLQKHMEKEKKEELAASLKLSQCRADIKNIREEIGVLSVERRKYEGYPEEYKKLYLQKLELLKSSDNSEFLNKSHEIGEQLNGLKSNLKELQEAVSAGNQTVVSLNNAISKLDSAENWGVFDLLGGGLVTDLVKHSNIDEAKEYVQLAQTHLNRFKTELADIRICEEMTICTDGFSKFADFFFDGLIADWIMQTKIKESRESVTKVKENVRQILHQLESMCEDSRKKITALEGQLSDLILNT